MSFWAAIFTWIANNMNITLGYGSTTFTVNAFVIAVSILFFIAFYRLVGLLGGLLAYIFSGFVSGLFITMYSQYPPIGTWVYIALALITSIVFYRLFGGGGGE